MASHGREHGPGGVRPPSVPGLTPARVGVALACALGVALAVATVVWVGAGAILRALEAIGWGGFALYTLYNLATFPITGAAWWVLSGEPLRALPSFTFGRLLREAAADILPFSSIGGVVVGARGVALNRVDPAAAYGSTAVDLVTEIVAQIAFLAVGFLLLSTRLGSDGQARAFRLCFLLAMLAGLALVGGLLVAEGRGSGLLARCARRLTPQAGERLGQVAAKIAEIRRSPGRFAASSLLHLLGWTASAAGSWLALRLMGVAVTLPAMIAVDSLLSAAKSAAFVVPNALGVQEAAYALIGHVFGLGAETGVALSLLRRAKDIVLGAPALLIWQAMEGRRLLAPAESRKADAPLA